MKLFASLLVLSVGALFQAAPAQIAAPAAATSSIVGIWQGTATARGGAQVPVTIRISGSGAGLKLALLNGPADHPDEAPASSVTFDGTHLVASYDYFARKLDATLADGTLTGTYGAAREADAGGNGRGAPTPFTVSRVAKATDPAAASGGPDIHGSWWIETKSAKGESAWEFRVDPQAGKSPVIKAVIQRIDGDTGGLWGTWNGTSYTVGHFNAAGAAVYSVTPQADGTLLLQESRPARAWKWPSCGRCGGVGRACACCPAGGFDRTARGGGQEREPCCAYSFYRTNVGQGPQRPVRLQLS